MLNTLTSNPLFETDPVYHHGASSHDDLVDRVDLYRVAATRQLDPGRRSEMGQFLTPPSVARYTLRNLGVTVDEHGKMPDVVIYHVAKDWLLLVEAVTSHGPVDAKRRNELAHLFRDARPGLVYVTAFLNRSDMTKHTGEISWATEVWVADAESHLIHFNGERFLGPYDETE